MGQDTTGHQQNQVMEPSCDLQPMFKTAVALSLFSHSVTTTTTKIPRGVVLGGWGGGGGAAGPNDIALRICYHNLFAVYKIPQKNPETLLLITLLLYKDNAAYYYTW